MVLNRFRVSLVERFRTDSFAPVVLQIFQSPRGYKLLETTENWGGSECGKSISDRRWIHQ